MQTYLPLPDYEASAAILDPVRLNKQIVEAFQILTGRVPCSSHPACLMWRGHDGWLWEYLMACCREYTRRTGKIHSCQLDGWQIRSHTRPAWLGQPLFHLAHRVNLLRKAPEHYAALAADIPCPDLDAYPLGYYWPVEPVGKKARADRQAWLAWAKDNGYRT